MQATLTGIATVTANATSRVHMRARLSGTGVVAGQLTPPNSAPGAAVVAVGNGGAVVVTR